MKRCYSKVRGPAGSLGLQACSVSPQSGLPCCELFFDVFHKGIVLGGSILCA